MADFKSQEENYNEESDNDFDANEWKGVESEGENLVTIPKKVQVMRTKKFKKTKKNWLNNIKPRSSF